MRTGPLKTASNHAQVVLTFSMQGVGNFMNVSAPACKLSSSLPVPSKQ